MNDAAKVATQDDAADPNAPPRQEDVERSATKRSTHDTPDSGLGSDPLNGPVNVPPKTSLPEHHPNRRPDMAPGPVEPTLIDPLRP